MGSFESLIQILYLWLRPLLKAFLRRTTGLCELQRICYGTERGAKRTILIENSLKLSRTPALKKIFGALRKKDEDFLVTIEYAIEATLQVKKIKISLHERFIYQYRECLYKFYAYNALVETVSNLRSVSYDPEKLDHVAKLRSLWDLLMPDVKLTGMISKQWSEIGFQGEDPRTDFRGMGLLGLCNLHYFANTHTQSARNILQHAHHPVHGFPLAIVGINLTHLAYTLLTDSSLKTHLFNVHTEDGLYKLDHFNKIYCYLFFKFDKLWLASKPESIMEFRHIRDIFEEDIRSELKDDNVVLNIAPFYVDNL